MDITKHADVILASMALVTAAGTAVYTHRRLQEMDKMLVQLDEAGKALTKSLVRRDTDSNAIAQRLQQIDELTKMLKVGIANIGQDIADLSAAVDEDREQMSAWSAAVVQEISKMRPESSLQRVRLGGSTRPRQRTSGRHTHRKRRTVESSDEETDTAAQIARFKSRNQERT